MTHVDQGTRAAGGWLAVASFLLATVLVFHGPLAPTLDEQMRVIAEAATRWAVVHWIAAVALASFAVAGLLALATGPRLTGDTWTRSAWAVVPVGCVSTMVTAVLEVTVVADAAASGNRVVFEAWWAFGEGMGTAFAFVALAFAVLAGHEVRRPDRVTPAWAARIGALAGVLSFIGWVLGVWLDVAPGNLIWVVSSFALCLWTLWFGLGLTRATAAPVVD